MSRTPKITRAARRIRDTYSIPLTAAKSIAQALNARGWLDDDHEDAIRYTADVALARGGRITLTEAEACLVRDEAIGEPVDDGLLQYFRRVLDSPDQRALFLTDHLDLGGGHDQLETFDLRSDPDADRRFAAAVEECLDERIAARRASPHERLPHLYVEIDVTERLSERVQGAVRRVRELGKPLRILLVMSAPEGANADVALGTGSAPLTLSGSPGVGKANVLLTSVLHTIEQYPLAQVYFFTETGTPADPVPEQLHLYDPATDPDAAAKYLRDVTAEIARREALVAADPSPLRHQPLLQLIAPMELLKKIGDFGSPRAGVMLSGYASDLSLDPGTQWFADVAHADPVKLADLADSEELLRRIEEIVRGERSSAMHTVPEAHGSPALILSTHSPRRTWPGARVYDGNGADAIAEFTAALRVEVERREAEAARTGANVTDQIPVVVEGVRIADHPDLFDLIRRCTFGRLLGIMLFVWNDQLRDAVPGVNPRGGQVLAVESFETLREYLDRVADPDRTGPHAAVIRPLLAKMDHGIAQLAAEDDAGSHRHPLQSKTDHRVDVAADGTLTFSCTAAVGASCREVCANGCEEYHAKDCDRTMIDGGECNALLWLNGTGTELEAHTGELIDRSEWVSGPIETWWDNYQEMFLWRFAGEEGDEPSLRNA